VAALPRVRTLFPAAQAVAVAAEASVSPAFFGGEAYAADERGEPEEATRVPCDRATLVSLYGELAPRVHRFLADLLCDRVLASDATQETFVRAFRRVDGLPEGTRLVAWVFGVARNVSLEMRKARGRASRVMTPEEPGDHDRADRDARSPEAELLDREALHVVQRALSSLPEERRAVLLLRLDHGLAYDEIATTMGWSLAKVKVEIFRAREVLRATFAEYRGGEP
jgi:RNA polymerase sigma-70 factor (ECF subfamily)